jgi:hypothetical protein
MRPAKSAARIGHFGNASASSEPELLQACLALEDREVFVDMSYAENAIEPNKPGILRDRRPSTKLPNSSHPARPSGSSNLARAPTALTFSSRNMPRPKRARFPALAPRVKQTLF